MRTKSSLLAGARRIGKGSGEGQESILLKLDGSASVFSIFFLSVIIMRWQMSRCVKLELTCSWANCSCKPFVTKKRPGSS